MKRLLESDLSLDEEGEAQTTGVEHLGRDVRQHGRHEPLDRPLNGRLDVVRRHFVPHLESFDDPGGVRVLPERVGDSRARPHRELHRAVLEHGIVLELDVLDRHLNDDRVAGDLMELITHDPEMNSSAVDHLVDLVVTGHHYESKLRNGADEPSKPHREDRDPDHGREHR